MYAVVEAGGRQVELTAGRYVEIDMVAAETDQEYVFDRVLMIVDGADSMMGSPIIEGAKITARVIDHVRDKKLIVYKYRPKKGTRKRTGHRQHHTRVFISKIEVGGKVLAEVQDPKKEGKGGKAAKAEETAAPAKESKPAKETKAKAEPKETKEPKAEAKTTKKKADKE
ncbi:MAG: 50S ribosomal protein L21 [Candidatus Obscuribacterales bacterium]|jgi:large subunit ribosomal protein L21|nr:50S ribosomal protein L21 [Candidatus Obscuribacterales bacterium]